MVMLMSTPEDPGPMKIIVLVKEVPDTYGERKLDLETGLADRAASESVLDEISERALEVALAHAGSHRRRRGRHPVDGTRERRGDDPQGPGDGSGIRCSRGRPRTRRAPISG